MQSPPSSSLAPHLQQQLAQLEELAALQAKGDAQADAVLSVFRKDAACIAQSRLILDHSTNVYALFLAARSLKELLTIYFHTFTGAQTIEIRNYLLNWLANACNNPQVERFVINELVDTIARVVKLGWRQDPTAPAGSFAGTTPPGGAHAPAAGSHAAFVETCGTFFQHSMRHHEMGLLLLEQVVTEMEEACSVESPSDHRKTSRIFRDHALLEIVRIAINELRNIGNFVRAGEDSSRIEQLLLTTLHTFSTCMSFDFIGSVLDETTTDDSNVTLQVPSSWRSLVEDTSPSSPAMLFAQIFEEFKTMSGVQAECLNAFTCLASVRRTLFTNDESRVTFMKFLQDTQGTLIQKYGTAPSTSTGFGVTQANPQVMLEDSQIYHEFCRFVARFKYNFTLSDLVRSNSFENWLQTLFRFTIQNGFSGWDGEGANSLSYLLGVWSRIAADVSQLKMSDGSSTYAITNAHMLNPAPMQVRLTHTHKVQGLILDIIPQICETFITARLDSVASMLRGSDGRGIDDESAEEVWRDIFAEPNLSDQLKYLSVLCRFHYTRVKGFLKSRLDPLVEQYKALLQALMGGGSTTMGMGMGGLPHTQANTSMQFQIVESQLSMLIYIIGCIVGCEKSLFQIHHPNAQPQTYPFTNADRLTTQDHLQLLDAELTSWIVALLPIINVRIETSSDTAAASRQLPNYTSITCLSESRSRTSLSILYFFQEFRKKYLNSLAHQSFESYSSYSRSGIYGVRESALAPSPTSANDMDGATSNTTPTPSVLPIPTAESIGHGPAANIFSRTAFFTQKPFTPQNALQLMVKQILLFLNYNSKDFEVVRETLELFDSLSLNYATSGQISSLDEVKQFLSGSGKVRLGSSMTTSNGNVIVLSETKPISSSSTTTNSSNFSMMDMTFLHSTTHPKLQKIFYSILSRLVFKGSNIDYFPQFIQPFTEQLSQLSLSTNLRAMPKDVIDQVVLLIHKLHGVVGSINSSVVYGVFFDWFYETNNFSSLIVRLVENFWDRPDVLYPLLNFYGELIWNKSQRIRFDSNSPNGIILFKETYKIVSTYIQRMMMVAGAPENNSATTSTAAGNELYDRKLKGISKVLMLVSNTLNGGYVNSGIMTYYNDPTLKQCIQQSLQFAMSVRFSHIINHPKVAHFFFHFAEIIFKSHMDLCVELCETPKFLALISSLHEGLLSVHQQQVIQAANAIEHCMEYQFKQQQKKPGTPSRVALERHFAQSSTLLPEILCTLFNINLFDNIDQSWSLSRPIFGMLLCHPDALNFYLQRLLQSQTLPLTSQAELASKIQAAADQLMKGVPRTWDHAAKDTFASNLIEFRTNITAFCTRPI